MNPVPPESTSCTLSSLHQHYVQVMPPNNSHFKRNQIYLHLRRSLAATGPKVAVTSPTNENVASQCRLKKHQPRLATYAHVWPLSVNSQCRSGLKQKNMNRHTWLPPIRGVASGEASGARSPHLKSVPPNFTFGPLVAAYIQYSILKKETPSGFWPLLFFGPPCC